MMISGAGTSGTDSGYGELTVKGLTEETECFPQSLPRPSHNSANFLSKGSTKGSTKGSLGSPIQRILHFYDPPKPSKNTYFN